MGVKCDSGWDLFWATVFWKTCSSDTHLTIWQRINGIINNEINQFVTDYPGLGKPFAPFCIGVTYGIYFVFLLFFLSILRYICVALRIPEAFKSGAEALQVIWVYFQNTFSSCRHIPNFILCMIFFVQVWYHEIQSSKDLPWCFAWMKNAPPYLWFYLLWVTSWSLWYLCTLYSMFKPIGDCLGLTRVCSRPTSTISSGGSQARLIIACMYVVYISLYIAMGVAMRRFLHSLLFYFLCFLSTFQTLCLWQCVRYYIHLMYTDNRRLQHERDKLYRSCLEYGYTHWWFLQIIRVVFGYMKSRDRIIFWIMCNSDTILFILLYKIQETYILKNSIVKYVVEWICPVYFTYSDSAAFFYWSSTAEKNKQLFRATFHLETVMEVNKKRCWPLYMIRLYVAGMCLMSYVEKNWMWFPIIAMYMIYFTWDLVSLTVCRTTEICRTKLGSARRAMQHMKVCTNNAIRKFTRHCTDKLCNFIVKYNFIIKLCIGIVICVLLIYIQYILLYHMTPESNNPPNHTDSGTWYGYGSYDLFQQLGGEIG